MNTNWLPGPCHGLVWPQGMALIDGSMTVTAAAQLWERCAEGVTIGQFLEALAQTAGTTLLSLPGVRRGAGLRAGDPHRRPG